MIYSRSIGLAVLLGCALTMSACSDPGLDGQVEAVSGVNRSDTLERLAERSAPRVPEGASAPSFTIDPSWPKPLPNNWRISQVGGIAVDQHDNIWVYHRARALERAAAAGLGVAGTNEDSVPVDGLGNPRVFAEQTSGCCVPAPSVLKFDMEGNLLDA